MGEGSSPVVRDISLEVKAGDRIAVVGHGGAGKTTFLKLCAGILRPSKGEVVWNEEEQLFQRDRTGFIFQQGG